MPKHTTNNPEQRAFDIAAREAKKETDPRKYFETLDKTLKEADQELKGGSHETFR